MYMLAGCAVLHTDRQVFTVGFDDWHWVYTLNQMGTGRVWRQPEAWRVQARELKQARSLQQDDREYGSYKVVTVEVFESNRCYMDEYSICALPGCTLRVSTHSCPLCRGHDLFLRTSALCCIRLLCMVQAVWALQRVCGMPCSYPVMFACRFPCNIWCRLHCST